MAEGKDKLIRTTVTVPASLKERMSRIDVNWSEILREMISRRLEEEGEPNMAEAVILNERVKRPAPRNWDSLKVIKQWRRKKSS